MLGPIFRALCCTNTEFDYLRHSWSNVTRCARGSELGRSSIGAERLLQAFSAVTVVILCTPRAATLAEYVERICLRGWHFDGLLLECGY